MESNKKSGPEPPAPIYAVCGGEAFLKREALASLTGRVLGDADRALALSEYDGSAGLAEVLDDLRTLPFLAARRVVVLRDADPFITRWRGELEAYAENPSPTGVLLIECKSMPATTRLCKRIQAIGEVIKCEPLKGRAIGGWLTSRAREAHGCRLDGRAAELLRALIGDDLGLLDAELQKLAIYVSPRTQIEPRDVEALAAPAREEQVWGIVSAIAAGDESRALRLWEDVWQTDAAASARAIAGIAFTVRRLLNAKRAEAGGASVQELARILMRWGDPQEVKRELSAFTVEQVEGMLCELLEADVAAKTGGVGVRTSVERFIVASCRSRRGRRATG